MFRIIIFVLVLGAYEKIQITTDDGEYNLNEIADIYLKQQKFIAISLDGNPQVSVHSASGVHSQRFLFIFRFPWF